MLVFIVQIHFFPNYIVLVIHVCIVFIMFPWVHCNCPTSLYVKVLVIHGVLLVLYKYICKSHFFPNYIVLVVQVHDVSIYSFPGVLYFLS